jgi:signal transduction histidine kinase
LALGLALHEAISGGAGHAGEALLRTLQGERWHAIDARAVRDPVSGLAMLLVNARDISDLKAALLALEAARDAAEAANRAKSSFLANMSHEIRTPMNGVLGLTELVLASTLDDRQRHFLELAHHSAQSLMQIINDILDVSKIEADRMTLELAPMPLRETLDLALAPLQVQAVQRGLVLAIALAPDLPAAVVTDATRWRQVLLNLVGNALKFTASGRIDVALACRPGEVGGWQLDCTVSDTGIGMTADELFRVFAPFTQADASITRRYGGTGLGLTIVHRLVQLLGGRIDASSSPGAGSSFRFVVPVTLPEAR